MKVVLVVFPLTPALSLRELTGVCKSFVLLKTRRGGSLSKDTPLLDSRFRGNDGLWIHTLVSPQGEGARCVKSELNRS